MCKIYNTSKFLCCTIIIINSKNLTQIYSIHDEMLLSENIILNMLL